MSDNTVNTIGAVVVVVVVAAAIISYVRMGNKWLKEEAEKDRRFKEKMEELMLEYPHHHLKISQ